MESLRKVLQQYAGSSVTLGAKGTRSGSGEAQLIDRDALRQELKDLSRKNEKYFAIGIVMAAILFIGLIVVAFIQVNQPNAVKIASPIFGTSAAVVVWRMFKTWREKSYTDCVLALVPSVNEETLKTIVAVLVTKI